MIAVTHSRTERSGPRPHHPLLEGIFPAADARDALTAVVNAALNFHKLRNLREEVNRERSHADALGAIDDLLAAREELVRQFLAEGDSGVHYRVQASFSIERVSEEESSRV